MIRFSENQPWNFGIKPTEYFEQLSQKQKNLITLDYLSWESIDGLFDYVNKNCPNTRQIGKKDKEIISDSVDLEWEKTILPYQSALAVAYCKPITYFSSSSSTLYQREFLRKMSIKTKEKRTMDGLVSLAIGFSQKILEEFFKIAKGARSGEEFHLAMGIFLGYPLGDVFGCALNLYAFKEYFENVVHGVYDSGWTEEWKNKVGWSGEDHLAGVFKKYLNLK